MVENLNFENKHKCKLITLVTYDVINTAKTVRTTMRNI